MGSFSPHIGSSFAHAKIEKTEMINTAKLQMIIIRDKIQFIHNKFNQAAIKTIAKKTKFMNQI